MKRNYLSILIVCLLVACGNPEKENSSAEITPVSITQETVIVTDKEPDLSEIIPDDVYLNGTIILPPQGFASVTLVMGGTIHRTNLMPGEYVRKGTTLATLENIDYINLQ
ncbi:MAG: hypothetical protein LIP01_15845 [Tannerellaceae bacterium]|nr:hypothetical protein [Tannerellaceae bacterium]